MAGVFITFEGTEGSGKSTHAAHVAKRIAALKRDVVTTREPGGTPLGERIREVIKHDPAANGMSSEAETLLFQTSRAELVRRVIRPALERGAVVICDRFTDSTMAYQGAGRGMDRAQLIDVCRFATGGLTPNLTILMDVDVDTSLRRMKERNQKAGIPADRIEVEDRLFHQRIRQGFLDLAAANHKRIRRVDARGSFDAVATVVWNHVTDFIGVAHDA